MIGYNVSEDTTVAVLSMSLELWNTKLDSDLSHPYNNYDLRIVYCTLEHSPKFSL